jgi:cyanophycin synthetase
MNIKVLQGLNLQSSQTTVVAEMEKVKPELLDFYKDMHKIFLKDYEIKDDSILSVKTEIPSLWKLPEFLQAIEDYSTDTITLKEAKKKTLEITKKQIYSMSSVPIFEAAQNRNKETIQLFTNEAILSKNIMNRYFTVGIGHEYGIFVSAASSGDSSLAKKVQKNKSWTNQLIESMELPIAKWAKVEKKEDLEEIAKDIGFPLVIKPVGLTAGHGVHVGINTLEELQEAYDSIQEYFKNMKYPKAGWQKRIIVQKMVPGDDHRILVVNGKVEIATHRIPARVKGDGRHTIEQLIELENKNPQRDKSKPTHTLKPIKINEKLKSVINENGYKLSDIPEEDEIVYVRKVASMSQGGITADVTDKLNPQIKYICESIAQSIQANVLGVDVLAVDISKPLTKKNGSIIEMNTMPEIYLNAFPVIGKSYPDIGEKILDGMIDPDRHTNRIVALGEFSPEELLQIARENLENTETIGIYSENALFVNGEKLNDKINIHNGVLGLKKNGALDTIVLNYKNQTEVANNGLGFNLIDLVVIKDETEDEFSPKLKKKLEKYQKAQKINKIINT